MDVEQHRDQDGAAQDHVKGEGVDADEREPVV
jgi:hypothetical protein